MRLRAVGRITGRWTGHTRAVRVQALGMAPAVRSLVKALQDRRRVEQITEELAHMVLFREEAGSQVKLPAAKLLAKRWGCSRHVVHEAIERLASIGLLEVKHGSGITAGPLHVRKTMDALEIQLRAERAASEARSALREFCDVSRYVTVESLVRCAGLTAKRKERVVQEIKAVALMAKIRTSLSEHGEQIQFVTWLAGSECGELALHLAANSLERTYAAAKPWLLAAIDQCQQMERWDDVAAFVSEGRPEEVRRVVAEVLGEYHARALELIFVPPDPRPESKRDVFPF